MVFVELRRPHHAPPPALGPKRLPVEALEEEVTRLRQAQASEKGGEGGLAATGGAFEEDAVTRADPQVATSENGLAPLVVAEDEVTRIEDRLSVLSLGSAGAECERKGGGPLTSERAPAWKKRATCFQAIAAPMKYDRLSTSFPRVRDARRIPPRLTASAAGLPEPETKAGVSPSRPTMSHPPAQESVPAQSRPSLSTTRSSALEPDPRHRASAHAALGPGAYDDQPCAQPGHELARGVPQSSAGDS